MTKGASRSQLLKSVDASGDFGFKGSAPLNVVGGVLSGLGLAMDAFDMVENGIGIDNSISASGNAAGVLSAVAGATPLGAAAAGWSLGTSAGQAGINHAREHGYLGSTNTEYESAGNRGWDDLAADAGRRVRDGLGGGVVGGVAGGVTTIGASVVGAAGAAGSAVAGAAEGAGRRLFGCNHSLFEGIGPQIRAANTNAAKGDNR
jgi:hypothetical protein